MFIAETWAKTNMTRPHGRALRSRRLIAAVPHRRWTTMTFLAALRCDGIAAPCVFSGPINGASFLAWVVQLLAPTLRPGDIVVLDNLGSHKGVAARRAVRQAGAHLLLLPPCSPDLNLIEMTFAKLKALPRKADKRSIAAAPPPPCGAASVRCLTGSARQNAQTMSGTPVTNQPDTDML